MARVAYRGTLASIVSMRSYERSRSRRAHAGPAGEPRRVPVRPPRPCRGGRRAVPRSLATGRRWRLRAGDAPGSRRRSSRARAPDHVLLTCGSRAWCDQRARSTTCSAGPSRIRKPSGPPSGGRPGSWRMARGPPTPPGRRSSWARTAWRRRTRSSDRAGSRAPRSTSRSTSCAAGTTRRRSWPGTSPGTSAGSRPGDASRGAHGGGLRRPARGGRPRRGY